MMLLQKTKRGNYCSSFFCIFQTLTVVPQPQGDETDVIFMARLPKLIHEKEQKKDLYQSLFAKVKSPSLWQREGTEGRECEYMITRKKEQKNLLLFRVIPPGLDRQSEAFGGAGIPLKINISYSRNLNKMPDGIAKNDRPARQSFDLESVTGACTRPHYTKQNNRSKMLRLSFKSP